MREMVVKGLQMAALVYGGLCLVLAGCQRDLMYLPERLTEAEALGRVEKHLDGFEVTLEDSVPGALPGLDQPAAAALIDAVGEVRAKYGWTDVARFYGLAVPAVNFGAGDPSWAHKRDEHVPVADITRVSEQLRAYLTTPAS